MSSCLFLVPLCGVCGSFLCFLMKWMGLCDTRGTHDHRHSKLDIPKCTSHNQHAVCLWICLFELVCVCMNLCSVRVCVCECVCECVCVCVWASSATQTKHRKRGTYNMYSMCENSLIIAWAGYPYYCKSAHKQCAALLWSLKCDASLLSSAVLRCCGVGCGCRRQ